MIPQNDKSWVDYSWLIWVLQPFETVVQSISGRLPERGGGKRKDRRERKKSKQPPPAPTASEIGPCPTNA